VSGLDHGFTVVIPTINSERWISHLHRYYQSIGVDPLYCIDRRTRDNTCNIISSLGARHAMVTGKEPRIESLILSFKNIVTTPWILRIDDDECPSKMLVDWIRGRGCEFSEDVVAFSRKWLRFTSPTKLEYAASRSWDWDCSHGGEDRSFRLYRKDSVDYVTDIHTPGFRVTRALQAPSAACIYHFDWILRSKSERLAKMQQYEAQQRGAGDFAKFYIHEEIKDWDYGGEIEDRKIVLLARQLRCSPQMTERKLRVSWYRSCFASGVNVRSLFGNFLRKCSPSAE
jgi:hypothetical protein